MLRSRLRICPGEFATRAGPIIGDSQQNFREEKMPRLSNLLSDR
jgi:hypothetical protein